MKNVDHIRKMLMFEPRGHYDMYGGIVMKPLDKNSDIGFLLFYHFSQFYVFLIFFFLQKKKKQKPSCLFTMKDFQQCVDMESLL